MQRREMLGMVICEGHLSTVWKSGGWGRARSRGRRTGTRPSWSSAQLGKGNGIGGGEKWVDLLQTEERGSAGHTCGGRDNCPIQNTGPASPEQWDPCW